MLTATTTYYYYYYYNNNYNKEFFDVMDTGTKIGIYATGGVLFCFLRGCLHEKTRTGASFIPT